MLSHAISLLGNNSLGTPKWGLHSLLHNAVETTQIAFSPGQSDQGDARLISGVNSWQSDTQSGKITAKSFETQLTWEKSQISQIEMAADTIKSKVRVRTCQRQAAGWWGRGPGHNNNTQRRVMRREGTGCGSMPIDWPYQHYSNTCQMTPTYRLTRSSLRWV